MNYNRLVTAIIIGAVLGVTFEYVISPYITKPITKTVDEVIPKWKHLKNLKGSVWNG